MATSNKIQTTRSELRRLVEDEMMSNKQIADYFGVTVDNVKEVLNQAGLSAAARRKRKPVLSLAEEENGQDSGVSERTVAEALQSLQPGEPQSEAPAVLPF